MLHNSINKNANLSVNNNAPTCENVFFVTDSIKLKVEDNHNVNLIPGLQQQNDRTWKFLNIRFLKIIVDLTFCFFFLMEKNCLIAFILWQ